MTKQEKKDYFLGDYIQAYYDCLQFEKDPAKVGLPTRDLSYIVSLLSHKFNRKFSYQEVEKLLKEENIPRHNSGVPCPRA